MNVDLDNMYEMYSNMLQNDFLMPDISTMVSNIDKKEDKLSVKNTTKNKKKRYNIPNVAITRHNHIGQ